MLRLIARTVGMLVRCFGFRRVPNRRNIRTYPDDLFIVSYPKSGNTWVRFLIASILHGPKVVDFTRIERLIPTIYHTSLRQLDRLPRPRTLKSHEFFHPEYAKVIYIVRDPRDVAVSYFHFLRRGKSMPMDRTLTSFIPDFITGAVDRYGSWGDHVSGWVNARNGDSRFLLIRYEDLLGNSDVTLGIISRFLGRSLSPAALAEIIASCSSSRMRELEKKAGKAWVDSAPSDIPFVRKATSGGWREELDHECVRQIELKWAPIMSKFGYTSESGS